MDERLKKACEGKSASKGGMNIPELRQIATSLSLVATGSRDDLLRLLCTSTSVKAVIPSSTPPKKKIPKSAALIHDVAKLPKLQYGQVKINTASWQTKKPSTIKQRKDLHNQCGDKCYLIPDGYKYPVCAVDGNCDYDCDGLRSAYGWTSRVNNATHVSAEAKQRALDARNKATDIGKRHCGWE